MHPSSCASAPRPWQTVTLAIALSLVFGSATGWAQDMPDIGEMFANFSDASVSLMNLARGASFLLGLIIVFLGLSRLKEYSESNGGRVKLMSPIMLTFVGACLVALPGSIDMTTETLALGSNTGTALLSEPDVGGDIPGLNAALAGVLLFIKMVGHLAFIRGFLILKKHGDGDQNAGVGRAATHILGGAAAININATIGMLGATFAPGMELGGLGG